MTSDRALPSCKNGVVVTQAGISSRGRRPSVTSRASWGTVSDKLHVGSEKLHVGSDNSGVASDKSTKAGLRSILLEQQHQQQQAHLGTPSVTSGGTSFASLLGASPTTSSVFVSDGLISQGASEGKRSITFGLVPPHPTSPRRQRATSASVTSTPPRINAVASHVLVHDDAVTSPAPFQLGQAAGESVVNELSASFSLSAFLKTEAGGHDQLTRTANAWGGGSGEGRSDLKDIPLPLHNGNDQVSGSSARGRRGKKMKKMNSMSQSQRRQKSCALEEGRNSENSNSNSKSIPIPISNQVKNAARPPTMPSSSLDNELFPTLSAVRVPSCLLTNEPSDQAVRASSLSGGGAGISSGTRSRARKLSFSLGSSGGAAGG
jgi:hypothetical protein